jgi:2-keto-4-pentenoate hydratase/2-oxohepta-3-ene-1,7-dioic acid hydratase in catechol pathway
VDEGQELPDLRAARPLARHPDEVGDVQNLGMWLDVNGQRRQTGSPRR